jgi:hypothetical protein
MTKLIGISGSLRRCSFNFALLQAAAGLAPGGTELTIRDHPRDSALRRRSGGCRGHPGGDELRCPERGADQGAYEAQKHRH